MIGVDEIIEIGLVVVRGGEVIERFETLVWSDRDIPPWVARLTGISNDDLEGAPTFSRRGRDAGSTCWTAMSSWPTTSASTCRSCAGSSRGAGFAPPGGDRTVHAAAVAGSSGRTWPAAACPIWPSSFGVAHDNPHRAADDAAATAGVLLQALARPRSLGLADLGDLFRLEEIVGRARQRRSGLASRAAES